MSRTTQDFDFSQFNTENLDLEQASLLLDYIKHEKAVLAIHKNAISEISYYDHGKKVTKFQTRANWTNGGKLRARSRYQLIEALYKHYYALELPTPTVNEAFILFIEEKRKFHTVDSKTLNKYCNDWDNYFAGKNHTDKEIALGKRNFEAAEFLNMKISEVTASQIKRHLEYLVGDENITRKKLVNLRTPLIGAFCYAIDHDIICKVDPRQVSINTLSRRCKPENDNRNAVYTTEMFVKLKDYLRNVPKQTVYTLAIQLSMNLGARISEIRSIHWQDVDFDNCTIYLHRQMVDTETADGKHRVAEEKDYMKSRASSGKRYIPLSDDAIRILNELKEINGDKTYVLANAKGNKPITTNVFNDNLKRACSEIGIPYYSSHKIRFGVITALYEANIPEPMIQAWAGHNSITTTRHYDRRSRNIEIDSHTLNQIFK